MPVSDWPRKYFSVRYFVNFLANPISTFTCSTPIFLFHNPLTSHHGEHEHKLPDSMPACLEWSYYWTFNLDTFFFFCILLPSFLSFSILFIFQDPTTTPFLNQSSVYWALIICPISHHGKHYVYMVRFSPYPDPMSWALYPDTEIWWLMPSTIFPMTEWFPFVHILLSIHTFHIFHSLRFNPVISKTVLTESCI